MPIINDINKKKYFSIERIFYILKYLYTLKKYVHIKKRIFKH